MIKLFKKELKNSKKHNNNILKTSLEMPEVKYLIMQTKNIRNGKMQRYKKNKEEHDKSEMQKLLKMKS